MLKLAMSLYFKLSKSKKSRQCPARDYKPIGFFPQDLWKAWCVLPSRLLLKQLSWVLLCKAGIQHLNAHSWLAQHHLLFSWCACQRQGGQE